MFVPNSYRLLLLKINDKLISSMQQLKVALHHYLYGYIIYMHNSVHTFIFFLYIGIAF